ncbi:MAG: response regulator [Desulfatitalea sp.]
MQKVLAIDDKVDNLVSLSALLKDLVPGCVVITAQSGLEGIERAKTESPDVVLLDMIMPEMDGLETCRRLKSHESTKHIPVIMITALRTDAHSRIKGLEVGADAFLAKPIDPYELASQVHFALRIKKAEDDLRKEKNFLEQAVQEKTASLVQEITERKQAEEALRQSEERLRYFVDANIVGIAIINPSGGIIEANDYCLRIIGYTREEFEHGSIDWRAGTPPEWRPADEHALEELRERGVCTPYEKEHIQRDGTRVSIFVSDVMLPGPEELIAAFILDITERKQAEQEKVKLEAQLQQAQKMESIGRLAGGVAHDFNNMLEIILGHAEMVLENLDPAQPIFADLTEIRKAANRSADLTRQLLAFARKQTVAPKVLDLNETVEGMLRMLRRLIGEDIDLAWLPGKELWPVKVDPSQIDQILANLCVNARDAITGVGKVTIGTGTATLDDEYCATHAGFMPGEYVRLAVSDDGSGMDKVTLSHIFEPFFTTKEVGEGTGLGLATVYGAVKQNKGFITVDSESGKGTTFTIYLPRHMGEISQAWTEDAQGAVMGGQETILLVEDEPGVLKLTKMMLERRGYTVLAANKPGEANRLAREHPSQIHLLITDVIMPGMNGRELWQQIGELRPDTKCLFMSGYTANVIAHRGVLDEGVHFIQKPFSKKDLAAKVREVLDQKN